MFYLICLTHASFATYKIRIILDLSLACVWTANARGLPWLLLWVCSHFGTDVLACFSRAGKLVKLLWENLRERANESSMQRKGGGVG
jgi:hypothetical protein